MELKQMDQEGSSLDEYFQGLQTSSTGLKGPLLDSKETSLGVLSRPLPAAL